MANIYKNAKVDLTTTNNTTVYTAPSNSRAIIKSILVSEDSNNADTITLTVTDAADAVFSLFKEKAISAKATNELLTQPLVLLESEALKAQAATANRLHVVVSISVIGRDYGGKMVSFVEKGKTDAIVNGTVIKDVEIETEVTVKNIKTNVEYKSDKEAEDDVNDPGTDTKQEDISRSVNIKVAKLPDVSSQS